MIDGTVTETVLSLEKAKHSVERSLIIMQREITGFCAGTGKSKELNDIGKSVNPNFDFIKAMEKFELEFANLTRAQVMARENLDSCVNVPPDVITQIQRKIDGIQKVQSETSAYIREIKAHNEEAKKYPINSRNIAKIKKAGLFAKMFSRELKSAKQILQRIESKYKTNFSGFIEIIDNAKSHLRDYNASLMAKKQLIEEHDQAVDDYRSIKARVDTYNIHEKFSDLLVTAFNDKRFIYAFAMMAGKQGKTVVDAVFRHRLLCTLMHECGKSLEELEDSPYNFENEHNAKVILSKIRKVIGVFETVNNAEVSFDFTQERNFEEMYRSFLREISKATGVSMVSYKDRVFNASSAKTLKLDVLTLSTPKERVPDYHANDVESPKKSGLFSNLLKKNSSKKTERKSEPLLVG